MNVGKGERQMDESIILVDENDNEIGYGEKLKVHQEGQLHRAFSIFIFDWSNYKMLLQKRAGGKYHSGGKWSNACCSHPRRGQSMETALKARLLDELGMDVDFRIVEQGAGLLLHGNETIYHCGQFIYYADFGGLSEHELDHVFLYSPAFGSINRNAIHANPEEAEDIRWVTIGELQEWMERSPEDFSAWFKPAFDIAYEVLCRQARNMDMFERGSQ